jgi:two-component system, chemotaxis family, protein-glutamate methylesterase/glutaminase
MKKRIRTLLIDDSPIVINILKRILAQSQEIEVVGTAANGKEGIEKLKELDPDVICTDLMMPVMNGLELTKEIMQNYPKPILVVSSALEGKNQSNVFQLLEAGALEVFPKPQGGSEKDYEGIRNKLESKIKMIHSIPVFKSKMRRESENLNPNSTTVTRFQKTNTIRYLVIGASTGGPNALQKILERLPETLSVPVICVQHINDGFIESLVAWLNQSTKLKIKIMEDEEVPISGRVYFPKDKRHLVIDASGKLKESREVSINGHTPSINITFKSFATHRGSSTLGVILTGMGDDGASGLLSIKHMGGKTIGESADTCVVYGMPRVAHEIGAIDFQLPLDKIPEKIMSLVNL